MRMWPCPRVDGSAGAPGALPGASPVGARPTDGEHGRAAALPVCRPWRDGSTALLLDPLELLERLAALVPPPRRPLLAYHGVLAPRARWRAAIVPTPSPADARAAPVSCRWPWARLLRRVFAFEVLVCPRCGGPRRMLGAVTEPYAVRRLLAALGLAAEPPPDPVVSAT